MRNQSVYTVIMHTHVQPGTNFERLPSPFSTSLFFLRQSFSLNLEPPSWLNWLTEKILGVLLSLPLSFGTTGHISTDGLLCGYQRCEIRSLCLPGKHLNHWTISPEPSLLPMYVKMFVAQELENASFKYELSHSQLHNPGPVTQSSELWASPLWLGHGTHTCSMGIFCTSSPITWQQIHNTEQHQ